MRQNSARKVSRRGIIFIVSAPSGAGKTTLINALRSKYAGLRLSVSCTTRARRSGEVNGRHYRFLTPGQFAAMKKNGQFAEWASVHDHLYGTPKQPLEHCAAAGRDILLDIDVQGACAIKRRYRDAVSIFILPPSLRELGRRLARRGTDDKRMIARRLAAARDEIRNLMDYDYYVVNREVESAVRLLSAIVEAERAKTSRLRPGHADPFGSGRAAKKP
jgi:guanylate kinase